MKEKIDARGLACPQPVVQTKNILDKMIAGTVTVLVDNPVACENVKLFAGSQDCTVQIDKKANEYILTLTKKKRSGIKNKAAQEKVILISTDTLGHGERKLGETLMVTFLYTLGQAVSRPKKIILLNNGVKLAADGSRALEALEILQNKGVAISSCGTCADFYQLKDKLKVGMITNMMEIVESVTNGENVIFL